MPSCSRPNVVLLDPSPDHGDTRLVKFLGAASRSYERYVVDCYSDHIIDQTSGEVAELANLPLLVPCGTCPACRANKCAEYGVRAYLESLTCPSDRENIFLTLTYSDYFLPRNKSFIREKYGLGPVCEHPAYNGDLDFDSVSSFFRELRRKVDALVQDGAIDPFYWTNSLGERCTSSGLRYMYAGEYGDKNHRPHFHLLLFGVPKILLDDRIPFGYHSGNQYYKLSLFNELWGYGDCLFGEASIGSAYYTAGYALKKAYSLDDSIIGRVPSKARFSTQPGLGYVYFNQFILPQILSNAAKGDYKLPKILLPNGKYAPIPKYFLDKLRLTNPDIYDKIKVESYYNNFFSWSDLMSDSDFVGLDHEFYKNTLSNLGNLNRSL